MEFNKDFLGKLFEQATMNPRLRQSFDLRTSANDNSQRMLNVLLPGTVVPIQSHSKFFYLLNISELSILKNVTANDLETSYILFLSQLCNIQRTL